MIELAVLLAQMCVAEIDFPATPAGLVECQIMWSINDQTAQRWDDGARPGSTIVEVVHLYNSTWKCTDRACDTRRMKRNRELNAVGTRPQHWDRDSDWQRYRKRWLTMVRYAIKWLADDRPRPHTTRQCWRANHYGGAMDKPKDCWVHINCGPTRQRYYHSGRRCRDPKAARP